MNKKHVVGKVLSQARFAVYLLLILSMLAVPVAPAFAQAPAGGNTPPTALTSAQMQQIQQMQAQMELYQDAIQQMEAHIYLGRDKLLHPNVKSGDEIGVDPEIFAQLKAALDHTNDLLLERQINIGGRSATTGTSSAGKLRCNGWIAVLSKASVPPG